MKKNVVSFIICGVICLSFVGTSMAQTVPAAPVQTNSDQPVSNEPSKVEKKHNKAKKDHPHNKKAGVTTKKHKKHKKSSETTSEKEKTTQPQVNSVTN
ncbi:MAG: hypothetical protein WCH62_06190 [Candidatus Omnitrophota bacterium]